MAKAMQKAEMPPWMIEEIKKEEERKRREEENRRPRVYDDPPSEDPPQPLHKKDEDGERGVTTITWEM
jgi:hypothetical protein